MKRLLITAALCLIVAPATAQQAQRTWAAGNGVRVTVVEDDFTQEQQFSSPVVQRPDRNGFFFVSGRKGSDGTGSLRLTGTIYYRGDWRRYDAALVRGGRELPSDFHDRSVVSCQQTILASGCLLSESFRIDLPPDLLDVRPPSGTLQIQIRARGGYPISLFVPVNHIEAVQEAITQ